jgi:Ca2+-binding EF-hand superfamily protein
MSNHNNHSHGHDHRHTSTNTFTHKEKLQASVSLHEMFRDFDINGDGAITSDEIRQIVGNELTREEIDSLIHAVNKKKDGKVLFSEFILMMSL